MKKFKEISEAKATPEEKAQLSLKHAREMDTLKDRQEREKETLMQKENKENFSDAQLRRMKKAYSTIKRIDPSSQNYKKLKTKISELDVDRLEQIARAKIRFVSMIAAGEYAKKSGKRLHARDYMESTELEEKYDSDKFFSGKGTPEQRLQLLKLQNKALRTLASSPKQNAIKKEIHALRKKMGMKVKEEVELEESVSEEVSKERNAKLVKVFDSLKVGDTVKIKFKRGGFEKQIPIRKKEVLRTGNRGWTRITFGDGVYLYKNPEEGRVVYAIGRMPSEVMDMVKESLEENVKISFHSKGAKTKWMKKQAVASKEIIKQTPTSVELPSRWKDLSKKKDHDEIFSVVTERKLTDAEMDKREKVAKAIEKDNPDMPMGKKMAIATNVAKGVQMENDEYDNEGGMALSQLRTAKSAVEDLMASIKEMDNLPEWVQSKLTKAVDYMDSVRDYMASEEGKEPVEESMARARADARRHMGGRGAQRGMAPLKKDVDNDATDGDRKAASKHIIQQLRKAADLPNGAEVEFKNGKGKVDRRSAQMVLQKYLAMKKPMDKEKFQANIKSLADVKKILGR